MSTDHWARKRRAHLERHRPQQAADMAAEGVLEEHCREIGEQVETTLERTRQQLLDANPVPAGADNVKKAAHLGMIDRQAQELAVTPLVRPMDEDEEAKIGPNGGYVD
jgi:hypothetical protein